MDVTPLVKEGTQIIQSYSDKGFKVSGVRYTQAIIVKPEECDLWCGKSDISEVTIDDFSNPSLMEADVVLLGTAAIMTFPDMDLRKALKKAGIKIDVMDSGAACRTYNVLVAEGRRVVALLLPL